MSAFSNSNRGSTFEDDPYNYRIEKQGPQLPTHHRVNNEANLDTLENNGEMMKDYFSDSTRVDDLINGGYEELLTEEELMKNQKNPGLMGLMQRFLPGGNTGRRDMMEARESYKQFDSSGNLLNEENDISRMGIPRTMRGRAS